MKRKLKRYIPPVLVDMWRRARRTGIRFSGPYPDWRTAAVICSGGYESAHILEKVRESTRRVVSGEAVAERDSVILAHTPFPFPVISVLLKVALERSGNLTVLDFGGALGSTYRHCASFLEGVRRLRWHIVEQPIFAECGSNEFQDERLKFFDSIDAAVANGAPDVVLASGVLQYMQDPARTVQQLTHAGARFIIFDRTPFSVQNRDLIVVQHVPSVIGMSTYPAWIFTEEAIKRMVGYEYLDIAEFDALDGMLGVGQLEARYKGIIFEKRAAMRNKN